MLACTPVEFDFLESLTKIFIIPTRRSQFIQEIISNNAQVRWIAVAMSTKPAFTRSYTENPFWYQQSDLRHIRILGGGQRIVDFRAAVNCHLYGVTTKALNFQDDLPSIPIDKLKEHYLLVFDVTS